MYVLGHSQHRVESRIATGRDAVAGLLAGADCSALISGEWKLPRGRRAFFRRVSVSHGPWRAASPCPLAPEQTAAPANHGRLRRTKKRKGKGNASVRQQ